MYHTLPTQGVTIHHFESRHRAKWLWYGRRERNWASYTGRMLKSLSPCMNTPAAPKKKQDENYRLNWIFFSKEHVYVIFRVCIFSRGTHAPPVLHSSLNTQTAQRQFLFWRYKWNTRSHKASQISLGICSWAMLKTPQTLTTVYFCKIYFIFLYLHYLQKSFSQIVFYLDFTSVTDILYIWNSLEVEQTT